MNVRLAPGRGALSVCFGLAPFFSDIGRARQVFLDAISSRFREVVPVSPDDFSFSEGSQPGDFRCRFRILGKGQVIALTADGLTLSLNDLAPFDTDAVKQILEKLANLIESDFRAYEMPRVTASFQQHSATREPEDARRYMSRFLDSRVSTVIQDSGSPNIEYRPGFRTVLRGEHWDLRRTIEVSEQFAGHLFIGTDLVVIGSPDSSLTAFPDLLYDLLSLADRATGLDYGEGT